MRCRCARARRIPARVDGRELHDAVGFGDLGAPEEAVRRWWPPTPCPRTRPPAGAAALSGRGLRRTRSRCPARRTARGRPPRSPRVCTARCARPGTPGRAASPGGRRGCRCAPRARRTRSARRWSRGSARTCLRRPAGRPARAVGERPRWTPGPPRSRRPLRGRCGRRPRRLTAAGGEHGAQADQPTGGQDAAAVELSHAVTSRARATRRGAGARRRASCPCRGRDRPRSRRAACRTAAPRRRRSGWRTAPASCCVFPTPPGNRLSPVKRCTPASSGPRQTRAMLPGVCPRRWITSRVCAADGHRVAVLDGALHGHRQIGGVVAAWATVAAPVASTISGSARWWSQCPCVVTTVRRSASPISRGSASRLGRGVDQQRLAARRVSAAGRRCSPSRSRRAC